MTHLSRIHRSPDNEENRTRPDAAPPKRMPLSEDTGTYGPTMGSRIGDVVPTMDPAEAADTGGVAINPTVILPASAGGDRDVGGSAYSADVPAGGPADTFFDAEAELAERRRQHGGDMSDR